MTKIETACFHGPMSRYTVTHPKKPYLKLMYGYYMSGFYCGVFDTRIEDDEEKPLGIISELSDFLCRCKRTILFKRLKEFEAPKDHMDKVARNIPF